MSIRQGNTSLDGSGVLGNNFTRADVRAQGPITSRDHKSAMKVSGASSADSVEVAVAPYSPFSTFAQNLELTQAASSTASVSADTVGIIRLILSDFLLSILRRNYYGFIALKILAVNVWIIRAFHEFW